VFYHELKSTESPSVNSS